MLIPAAFSIMVGDGNTLAFGLPALGAMALGAILFFLTRSPEPHTFRQDVFLIVVLGWLGVASVGSLPFVFSGLMGPVDAFFESMAGFTTTGASTIRVPEEVAPSLLLRSEEHTSELQSRQYLVCRLLLEKKNVYTS